MNEQNNRFSRFEPSQKSTPPGRYLSEEDKLTLIGGEGTAAVGKVYELTLVKE